MMRSHWPKYLLLLHFLCVLHRQTHGDNLVASTKTLNLNLTNIVFYNGSIYAAGRGTLFKLNQEDLTLTATASTCSSVECEDVNKILLLIKGRDEVLMCGTGNEGLCFIRSIADPTFGNITRNQSKDIKLLKVSGAVDRPAQAMITNDGRVIIAVTFGKGITADVDNNLTYSFAISTRTVDQTFGSIQPTGSTLKLNLSSNAVKTLEDYVIYFKGSFQTKDFSYFVTNQKDVVGGKRIVSKVMRLCQNDTDYRTYVDIELQCGDTYNIIQDVTILSLNATDSGKLFIGTFTNELTLDSAICVTYLQDINKYMKEAQEQFAMNNCNTTSDSQRYFTNHFRQCNRPNEITTAVYTCTTNSTANFKYVMGTTTFTINPKFKWNAAYGYITTVYGTMLNGTEPVVFAGTSKGNVLRLYLYAGNDLEMYNNISVLIGFPIRHISQQGENMFVMSDKKLFKYSITTCQNDDNCVHTLTLKNPLCGWCVLENRYIRRSECSKYTTNYWLPFYQGCVTFSTSPKGIAIGSSSRNVTVNVTNLPELEQNANISCLLKVGDNSIGASIPAKRDGSNLICNVTVIPTVVTYAVMQLKINGIPLERPLSDFLFYNCSDFTKCGDCVGLIISECIWCSESLICRAKNETCTPNKVSVSQIEQCPQLLPTELYVPADVPTRVTFKANYFPDHDNSKIQCVTVNNTFPAIRYNATSMTCVLNISIPNNSSKEKLQVTIKYSGIFISDYAYTTNVTVYRCENIGSDCTHCTYVNKTRYKCTWCNENCEHGGNVCSSSCPEPNITKVIPNDGPIYGGTVLTISGTDLGRQEIKNTSVAIADTVCNITQKPDLTNPDYEDPIYSLIYCTTGMLRKDLAANNPWSLNVILNGKVLIQTTTFTYQEPNVTALAPKSGPMSGGTEITLSGSHLGIGNRNVRVQIGSKECINARVVPQADLNPSFVNFDIVCTTTDVEEITTAKILTLFMNDVSVFNSSAEIGFNFKEDPVIDSISITKAILSGGTAFKVQGINMTYANKGMVTSTYGDDTQVEKCDIVSAVETICKVPKASTSIWEELNSKRKKRSPADGGIKVTMDISLDGVKKAFIMTYFKNPIFNNFSQGMLPFRNSLEQKITIMGQNLNLAAVMEDFDVTVGGEKCLVNSLTETYLVCVPPSSPPVNGTSVEVKVGNIQQALGDLIYEDADGKSNVAAIAVVGSVMAAIVIAAAIAIYKYRAAGKKAREMEKTLNEIEMDIKLVAREEFLDMHTCMSSVNKNLVEQGFPYHDYQQFACNIMFPPEYLLTESVVSNGKSTESFPTQVRRGLDSLEHLISNKFFLVSIISTMEKQQRFFIRDKANFAGNLCTILMGKMDYLKEIVDVLLSSLIKNSLDKKSQKSLFRRCESISEKLLTNWLALCMYPHIKTNTGSPLYLLYMSIFKTIEAGPIDAITRDAKYTLSEEHLLKKWSSSENDSSDLKFEAKNLTLNVVVDNSQEIFKCKVLDCDTISQVKEKCLNQIYINYPASQMGVSSQELNLEWHEGFSGLMILKDEDYSSKREKDWIRLNTLAHYGVKDGSNMALVDPNNVDNQIDYVNIDQINPETSCNINIDLKRLVAGDEHPVHPLKQKQWHLIKTEEKNAKQKKSIGAELYLNRLFTIKQQIIEYVQSFWDILLDKDHCPPPTLLLYNFLDNISEKLKTDQETLHSWKSHSYAIRVWTPLILNPALLFDVNVPDFVETNLAVISQVFIECFSLSPQKFTKDTPSKKLIFHNEMNQYREKAKEFYKNLKCNSLPSDEFQPYLSEVNMIQHTTNFNKVSALQRFYKQMKPFMDEIIDDLSISKEASNLLLDKKLEEIIELMEERT